MTPAAAFLERLRLAAEAAAAAESDYRREAGARVAILERDRAFAFRRVNLMRAVGDAARGLPEESQGDSGRAGEEMAVARALAVLRTRLGWSADSESRLAVLGRFAPLAVAMYRALRSGPAGTGNEIADTLDAFERWYEETYRTSFWTLFENEMPETPLVDF